MSEEQQNKSTEFMIEKIKQRPLNKRKLLRRTISTAFMAVVFGLVACVTFLVLEPVFNKWMYPEEEPQIVIFPEETEEMKPEEMLTTEEDKNEEQKDVVTREEAEQFLNNITLDRNNYKQLYNDMNKYVKELSCSMVTVTGIVSETDWFNNPYESRGQSFGVIIADNGKELLILTNYLPIQRAGTIQITFCDGVQTLAQIKQNNIQMNLSVLAVEKEGVPTKTQEMIKIATFGSSNLSAIVGTPVVALGSPMGVNGSVCYGMITTDKIPQNFIDCNYKMFMTDIYGSPEAKGVLFNLHGELIGIIGIGKGNTEAKNTVSAIGISEMKKMIAKMSNATKIAYMGVYGVDVTEKVHNELNVPFGAYINQVSIDSPAMLGGIQCGDVIVEFDSVPIKTYNDYVEVLLRQIAGDEVEVKVMRQVKNSYKEMTLNITLGTVE